MLHLATRQLKPGDVVVAAWSTECEDGFFGELLATSMRARGGIGLVLDRCRYGAAPKPMKFRVLAGRQLQGHGQGHPGLGRAPTVGANALVNPGDVVVGPTLDGRHRRVVVVPAACVGDVAEAARRLLDAPALEAACLKYID